MNAGADARRLGLDLVPFLGLPAAARVAVLGGLQALAADLASAGHVVLRPGHEAADVLPSCDALVVTSGALAIELVALLRTDALLVVVVRGRRGPVGLHRRLQRAGLGPTEVLALDSADEPTAVVTLQGTAASRWYVAQLRSPWSVRELLRHRLESLVAAGPARRCLYGASVVVARRV